MTIKSVQIDLGNGRPITIESGRYAAQANGAITISQGETVLFVAAVASDSKPGQDWFPLQVDYREKYTASGIFPGGFIKREARPSDREILTMRMTDRPLRPLFPKGFMDETQVYGLLLSYDHVNPADVLNICGASIALAISDIPFNNPHAALRVGRIDGEFIANPTVAEMEASDLDLIYAGLAGKTIMIEGDCNELSEEELYEALKFADEKVTTMIAVIKQFKDEVGKADKESTLFVVPEVIQTAVDAFTLERLDSICRIAGKHERRGALKTLQDEMKVSLNAQYPEELASSTPFLNMAYDDVIERVVRGMIVNEKSRMDGRGLDDLRPLTSQIDMVPRVHGCAIFERGETQALVLATLGSEGDAQNVENAVTPRMSKKFVLHYNFPNYSVGETGRIGMTSRREIGHGNLAERSIDKMMPKDYPYSVRLVSEVMSSNGSTSMASICGGTLALLDAGVPLIRAVAGITCGLISSGDEAAPDRTLLVDILGDEDHFGDMDFKVAGTTEGITGFQLDLKIAGLELECMYAAMLKNKESRLAILANMAECISEPRTELKAFAPRYESIKIATDRIGGLIGPGGKNIKAIVEATSAKIDISDDGTVSIFAPTSTALNTVKQSIDALVGDIEVGNEYEGKVVTIKDFGAFVEFLPGREGLVHISELSPNRVAKVTDVINEGDTLKVRVIGVDDRGKVSLSHKEYHADSDGTPSAPTAVVDTKNLIEELEVGSIERGTIKKILDFGVIVELANEATGMVHISEMADYRVKDIRDLCEEGDKITVKIIDIDLAKGRVKLSRKAAMADLD